MSFHSKKANKPLSITELVKEATNRYRTKEYIIKQRISICNVEDGNTVMVSDDVFYTRTPSRDKLYEEIFVGMRRNPNGKRIKTALSTRQYVE